MAQAGTVLAAPAALHQQIAAKGIPVVGVSGPPWIVTYDPSATQAQKDQGDALAAAFDGQDRRYRLLTNIYQSIQALTAAQRTNIWTDLSAPYAGSPRRYLSTAGINAGPIFSEDWDANQTTGNQRDSSRMRIEAMYTQDNCFYLDRPVFDNTISVLGVE